MKSRKATTPATASRLLKQGVGESKPFIAAGERDPYAHVSGLHVGGRPVEEVVPVHSVHLLTRDHTDEGIAERNNGKSESAVRVHSSAGDRAPVQSESRDGKLEQRRDFKQAGLDPWEAPDPMKELIEKHVPSGMRGKFMSPFQVRKFGMRGFEPILDQDGNRITLGELFLAQMPQEKAEQRNRVYREKDRARLHEVDQRNEKHARLDSAEAFRPIVREVAPAPGDDGLHSDWAD